MNIKSIKAIKFLFLILLLSAVLTGCGQSPTAQQTNQPAAQQSTTTPTVPSAANNSAGNSQTAPQNGKIAFIRDGTIYVADNASSPAKVVAKNDFPSISPSGKLLAYNRDAAGANQTRIIEVIDLATSKVQNFKAFSQYTQFEPLWSPDEKRLAFNILIDNAWQVGVVDLATGEWKALTKELAEKSGVYLGGWTAQGDSITCHSLENIYEVSLNGEMLKKIPIREVVSENNISSETNFSLSPDKKLLLYSIDQDPSQKLWEGTGVFVYDLEAKKSKRITPEGRNPRWLFGGPQIIYTKYIQTSGQNARTDVYTTDLNGKEQLFLTNASNASVAAKQ